MQSQNFDVWRCSFNDWADSLESFKESILERLSKRKEPLERSDSASVFWTTIRDFMRFLSEKEKDGDPDVTELRKQFEKYVHFEGAKFKEAKLRILDLCLEICAKFQG